MKTCEHCGANLDAAEKCDCAGGIASALAEPETTELAQIFQNLPKEAQQKLYYIAKGVELVADKAAG